MIVPALPLTACCPAAFGKRTRLVILNSKFLRPCKRTATRLKACCRLSSNSFSQSKQGDSLAFVPKALAAFTRQIGLMRRQQEKDA
jgi:hypothetical protein